MREFARAIGFLYTAAGALLLAFPEASRRLIQARAEFAQLSPGALRLLGAWSFMMGTLLVAVTTGAAMPARVGEVVPTERRAAA